MKVPVQRNKSLEVGEALHQLRGILALIEVGELEATATERAHMTGAIAALEALAPSADV